MARQRFIWPDIWTDPDFGRLAPLEQVLYIGCFSNADDDGRLLGDAAYLKTTVLPFQSISVQKVRNARNRIVAAMPKLALYAENGIEYLAFLNWNEWQKPKYPKPSRLPAPPSDYSQPCGLDQQSSGNASWNSSGNDSPNASGNDSPVGWVGLGREGKELEPSSWGEAAHDDDHLLIHQIDQLEPSATQRARWLLAAASDEPRFRRQLNAAINNGRNPAAYLDDLVTRNADPGETTNPDRGQAQYGNGEYTDEELALLNEMNLNPITAPTTDDDDAPF